MITFVDGGAVATIRDAATAMNHRLWFAAVTWFVYFARLLFEWVAYRRCRCLTLFVDTAIIAAFGGWSCIGPMIVGARQKGIAVQAHHGFTKMRSSKTIGLIAILPASTESVIARHVSDRRRPATKRSLRLPGHYSESGLPLGSRSDEV
jgi:hypothetical protein